VRHGGGPHGERTAVEEGAVVEEHASRVGAAAAGRGGGRWIWVMHRRRVGGRRHRSRVKGTGAAA
jgi:hypothetical protein